MKRTHVAIVLALLTVGLIAAAGVGMAGHKVDTDTQNATSSTSEITDGTTITYNSSTNSTLQINGTTGNTSYEILQGDYTLSEYENASDPDEITTVDGANNHTNLTLPDDETGYDGIEAGAGENVTLEYRVYNDSSLDNPESINVTVYWENSPRKSFIRAESNETETAEPGLVARTTASIPLIGAENTTDPAQIEDEIGVNGSNQSTLTVWVEDSSAQDALEETYDDADESETVTYSGWVTVDGEFVPVVSEESNAPDWVETDNESYAVVADDGERVDVYNADDPLSDDEENATVVVTGNEEMNIFEISGMLKEYGATTIERAGAMINGEVGVRDQFTS